MQKFMCYCTVFALLCLILNLGAISKYKPPGACIWRGDLREGFLRYEVGGLYLEGLIHGEAYFQNFYGDATVCPWPPVLFFQISL